MSAQLRRLGLVYERVSAYDAKDVSDAWLSQYFEDRGPLGAIPKGDRCCSLSHRRAWSAFLASGERRAIVLEDDVVLDDAAADLLRRSDWLPDDIDVLKLEHFGPDGQRVLVGEPLVLPNGRRIAQILSRHTGAAAYIISRSAAERLLALGRRWSVPVDHLLFNPNVSDIAVALRPHQLLPAIARQKAWFGGASDIRCWRTVPSSVELARREIVRAYYELRLLPRQIAQVLGGHATLARVANDSLVASQDLIEEDMRNRRGFA